MEVPQKIKNVYTTMYIAPLFTIAKIWKQPKYLSMNDHKKCNTHTHMHTHTQRYSAMRKMEILPFVAAWLDIEGIMLSEISQRKTNTV